MDRNQEMTDYTYLESEVVKTQNKVLKNTYWLLSLSMVPTIIGALLGLKFNIFAGMTGWMPMILFFVGMIGLIFAINLTKNSPLGIVFLLGFTFFIGLMLSQTLSFYLREFSNGAELIALAAGGTGLIFFGMAALATTIKRDISSWGKVLFIGLVMLIVALVANIFLQSGPLSIAISTIAVGLFSAYLLYDLKQVVDGGETNYIMATLNVYLDLINIFTSLLHLLSVFAGDD